MGVAADALACGRREIDHFGGEIDPDDLPGQQTPLAVW